MNDQRPWNRAGMKKLNEGRESKGQEHRQADEASR